MKLPHGMLIPGEQEYSVSVMFYNMLTIYYVELSAYILYRPLVAIDPTLEAYQIPSWTGEQEYSVSSEQFFYV